MLLVATRHRLGQPVLPSEGVLRRDLNVGYAKGFQARGFLSSAFGYLGKSVPQVIALHQVGVRGSRSRDTNSIFGRKIQFPRGSALVLRRRAIRRRKTVYLAV